MRRLRVSGDGALALADGNPRNDIASWIQIVILSEAGFQ